MSVVFRNVHIEPGTPIDEWPYEAIVTLIERGTLTDWLVLTRAIDADPWGPVARQVEEYLKATRHPMVWVLCSRALLNGLVAPRKPENEPRSLLRWRTWWHDPGFRWVLLPRGSERRAQGCPLIVQAA